MKALLPNAQRRHKKQQRRGTKPLPMRQSENASTDTVAGADGASSGSTEKAAGAGTPQRFNRHDGSSRHRRRGSRRPEGMDATKPREPLSNEPEPTLQEKIAILQSKFRRIN
jgi:hypothetical protein